MAKENKKASKKKTPKTVSASSPKKSQVKEVTLSELKTLVGDKIKEVRSSAKSAQSSQRFTVYKQYMDAVERALMGSGVMSS